MSKFGKYVVFDGMDGSGKGVQLDLLRRLLLKNTVFTQEPGGTPFAEEIRSLVRDNPLAGQSTPLNNFLLFWAAREELVEKLVMPSLYAGKNVFSDRGYSSTYAYQIYGEGRRDLQVLFFMLRAEVFRKDGRWQPELHIIYDLPPEVARDRVMKDAKRARNHFDDRPLEYYARVREGFKKFAYEHEVVEFVDATQTPEAMHAATRAILREHRVC